MVDKFEVKKSLEDLRVDRRKRPSTTTLVKILRSGSIKGKTTGIEFKTNASSLRDHLQRAAIIGWARSLFCLSAD
jgi:hypothetical protein